MAGVLQKDDWMSVSISVARVGRIMNVSNICKNERCKYVHMYEKVPYDDGC